MTFSFVTNGSLSLTHNRSTQLKNDDVLLFDIWFLPVILTLILVIKDILYFYITLKKLEKDRQPW